MGTFKAPSSSEITLRVRFTIIRHRTVRQSKSSFVSRTLSPCPKRSSPSIKLVEVVAVVVVMMMVDSHFRGGTLFGGRGGVKGRES